MSVVQVSHVHKSFGNVPVLKDVSFSVERGNVVVLIGRSGSGKSTMLRCLNGLETIQSGEIKVADFTVSASDVNLRDLRQEVGIVFQHYNLFPHLTVGKNVTLALTVVKKMKAAEARVIYDDVAGPMVVARVVTGQSCRPEDIIDHCARNLAPYKVPRAIEFCASLD